MTTHQNYDIVLTETKNNYFYRKERIMKTVTSAFAYRAYQAIFRRVEYSFAKHAHFQDKQKDRTGMSSRG